MPYVVYLPHSRGVARIFRGWVRPSPLLPSLSLPYPFLPLPSLLPSLPLPSLPLPHKAGGPGSSPGKF